MIAQLSGTLVHKSPHTLVIDVGGVGYGVTASLTTFSMLPSEGEMVTLMVHTHVREDALILYGFTTTGERDLFQRLIGVSGVGPKVALAILSGIPPADLINAIAREDIPRLNAIPGVGKKTAERIIVDLKDKLAKDPTAAPPAAASHATPLYDDALSALVNLGYTKLAAEKALKSLEWSEPIELEGAIRAALKELVPS